MKLWSIFRLRPILRDLARIAAALEENNRLLRLHWGIREKRPARPVEFGAFDVEAANKDWREKQAEAGLAEAEEGE
jgi:hypothetical protein